MNWKKGGLWVIIFFVVKGTISTLLIVTGAKYFDLSFMQLFVLILILLLISLISRKLLYRHKQNKKAKRAKYIREAPETFGFLGFYLFNSEFWLRDTNGTPHQFYRL